MIIIFILIRLSFCTVRRVRVKVFFSGYGLGSKGQTNQNSDQETCVSHSSMATRITLKLVNYDNLRYISTYKRQPCKRTFNFKPSYMYSLLSKWLSRLLWKELLCLKPINLHGSSSLIICFCFQIRRQDRLGTQRRFDVLKQTSNPFCKLSQESIINAIGLFLFFSINWYPTCSSKPCFCASALILIWSIKKNCCFSSTMIEPNFSRLVFPLSPLHMGVLTLTKLYLTQ